MKKKKAVSLLIKAVSLVAIGGVVATGAVLVRNGVARLLDKNINHLEQYCPFNNVLGVNHQIKKINYTEGYKASLKEDGNIEVIADAIVEESNGNKKYIAPEGYELEGSHCVKTLTKKGNY